MRQEVYIRQIVLTKTEKALLGVLATACTLILAGVAGLVTWNLLTTLSIKESNATDKREIWIEIGAQRARNDVQDVRLSATESRLAKIEDKR